MVDSVQTCVTDETPTAAGSVATLRAVADRLMQLAKGANVAMLLAGHVTKDGQIAGPRLLEHLVDVVLYFDGSEGASAGSGHRLLRCHKNRFGPTHEIGVFSMGQRGLFSVTGGSVRQQLERPSPGLAQTVCVAGSRGFVLELEALVLPAPRGAHARGAPAAPRPRTVGFDPTRFGMLAAVLQRAHVALFRGAEVFLNVPGGLRALDSARGDPACDLAVLAALLSSATGVALPATALFLGEVSLTGELRRGVPRLESRLAAAAKAGYETVYLPAAAMAEASAIERGAGGAWTLVPVGSASELAKLLDPDWLGPDAALLSGG